MPEKFEEFIKDNTPGPDGQPREKKQKEEDPGFFRRYVSCEARFRPVLSFIRAQLRLNCLAT